MAEQNTSEEVDLGYLFNKISGFFKSLIGLLFSIIAFFIKHIIVVVILIIIGIGIGYYLDKNKVEVYNNELIVIPNLESTQYFYDKVEALIAKVKDRDTTFLKKIVGPNYESLKYLEAEPIVDVYGWASGSRERVDLFRVLTEKQNIQDYIKNPQNNQYYKYHHLTIKIKGKTHSEEIINGIVDYFNSNPHFEEYIEAGRKNTALRIETTEKMLSQIDSLLKASAVTEKSTQNSPSISINDNSQLNDILQTKGDLMRNLLFLNKQKVDEQQIIKVASVNYNISDLSGFKLGNKIKFPLILVLLFSGFFFLKHIYRKMKKIAETVPE